MGKRKRKKLSSTLTWKAVRGIFGLLSEGVVKASPFLLVGVIGFGIFWGIRQNLYADPGFRVQSVVVSPEGALSSKDLESIEKHFLNQNLFKVPIQKVARQIEQNPRIRRARVLREFPNTVRIEISERTPFVQIRFELKGPYYSAAEDGFVLETSTARNGNLLLVEAYETERRPAVGKEASLQGLKEGIRLARAFWQHSLNESEKIRQIRLDHLGNVSLTLEDGPELRFGRSPLQKFGALDSVIPLLKGPERARLVYVDLQYHDLVVRKK